MKFPHPDLGAILASGDADAFQVQSSLVSSVAWVELPKHSGVRITVTLPLLSISPHFKRSRSGSAPIATIDVFSQIACRDVATEVIAKIRSEGLMLVPSLDRQYCTQSGEVVVPLLLADACKISTISPRTQLENSESPTPSCLTTELCSH